MSDPKNLKKLAMLRDIVVMALDNWIGVEKLIAESATDERAALVGLANTAYDAFHKAAAAIHSYSAAPSELASNVNVIVQNLPLPPSQSSASPKAGRDSQSSSSHAVPAPAPAAFLAPGTADSYRRTRDNLPQWFKDRLTAHTQESRNRYCHTWDNLPQWFKDRVTAHMQASRNGYVAQRRYELWNGGWATLPNKKRVMVYRNHAYESPTDRRYVEVGPLKHLGLYNHTTNSLEPSTEVPEIPQTLEGYPWTSAYEVHAANKKALDTA